MLAKTKKIYAILSILFLLVSYVFSPAYAVKASENTNETSTYVQISQDTAPVKNAETAEVIGELTKGLILKAAKLEGDRVYFQWGKELAYIDATNTQTVDPSQPFEAYSYDTNDSTIPYIQTKEKTAIRSQANDIIGYFIEGSQYPIFRELENSFEIIIGNQLAYIEKSPAITVVQNEETNPASTENKPNPQTNATNQVDSTSNQQSNATEATQPSTTIRASIASIKQKKTATFTASTKYFKVTTDKLAIYDNSTGKLVQVGSLEKGQEFPRVKDYGNWHQIKYGKGYGFVWKAATEPSNGATIRNINSLAPSGKTFTTIADVPVYDNSSGRLVKFATIQKGVSYPILKDYGNWYAVDVSGRTGYVHKNGVKLPFKTTDRYFEVIEDRVPIYDNRSGKLVPIAYLEKGQVFSRLHDIGNWHMVRYGQELGYVWKEATRPPLRINIKNEHNNDPYPTNQTFFTLSDTPVYDDSNGAPVQIATIKPKVIYSIFREESDTFVINIAGRIGYVLKDNTQIRPTIRYTSYYLHLETALTTQMSTNPQTDLYQNNKSYVHSNYIQVQQPNRFPTKGTVTAKTLNVHEGTGTTYWVVGTLKQGDVVDVVGKVGKWYEIKFGPWKNAKREDVQAYLDPERVSRSSKEFFQFLVLSENAGVPVNDLNNKILANKGILAGKGQAFIDAGVKYHINEIYLISQALSETRNGTSELANGVLVDTVDGKPVEPKKVYNMYGIGTNNNCPIQCGAEYAYKQGWFTPEAAIIGGAEYIANQYINNPAYKQDTLYKMRWNPANPGIHQRATDIGWAFKQARNLSQLYDLLDHYTLTFDVPFYRIHLDDY